MAIICWQAESPKARGWHFSIRHRVFVEEQRVIPFTDVDAVDRLAETIHVVSCHNSAAAGTVRLYRTDDNGRWKGDRLAVLPSHRATLVGGRLVHFAVSTAAALGGEVMDAVVQVQNVKFFRRLGWEVNGHEVPYFGLPHQPMTFQLANAAAVRLDEMPSDAHFELPAHRHSPSPLLVGS